MASRFVAAVVFGVGAIAACDVSQKTPEIVTPPTAVNPIGPAGTVAIGRDAQPGAETPLPDGIGVSAGDRSMRLYGPGVSRKRQIRI
jgi:hypothetical protein